MVVKKVRLRIDLYCESSILVTKPTKPLRTPRLIGINGATEEPWLQHHRRQRCRVRVCEYLYQMSLSRPILCQPKSVSCLRMALWAVVAAQTWNYALGWASMGLASYGQGHTRVDLFGVGLCDAIGPNVSGHLYLHRLALLRATAVLPLDSPKPRSSLGINMSGASLRVGQNCLSSAT